MWHDQPVAIGTALARLFPLVLVLGIVGCASSSGDQSATTFKLANDLNTTLTVRSVVPIVGESTRAAHQMIQAQGCHPPIGGCIVWQHQLPPGETATVEVPAGALTNPDNMIITGKGQPRRCMPIVPAPRTLIEPTFNVSSIPSAVAGQPSIC